LRYFSESRTSAECRGELAGTVAVGDDGRGDPVLLTALITVHDARAFTRGLCPMAGKDKHYTTQLRAALTAGSWASPAPGKAPNGIPLPWPELFRKFDKHNAGHPHATELAAVATQTQALALLLGASAARGEVGDAALDGDAPWATSGALALGEESLLAPERMDEARVGYDALRGMADGSKVRGSLCTHMHDRLKNQYSP
jgi:hypothetical protein